MENWLIYLKERFPLATYALLVGGLCASGQVISGGTFQWQGFALSFLGLLLFFGLLRLMDELKDYEKDVVAHPDRPLPRGVLKTERVREVVNRLAVLMFISSLALSALQDFSASVLYLVITGHLWLMYREFYVGDWLAQRPILYAITHQLILIPICLFTVATSARPEATFAPLSWAYGLAVLGAFFAYEVCRKLNPKAHPVLKTYLSLYGATGVTGLVLVLVAVAAIGAGQLGLGIWMWPFEALLIMSLALLYRAPEKYKLVEVAATLSLLFHIWGPAFQRVLVTFGVTI